MNDFVTTGSDFVTELPGGQFLAPVMDALSSMLSSIFTFVPLAITALVIWFVGRFIAGMLRRVLRKALDLAQFDTMLTKAGLGDMLTKAGTTGTALLGGTLYWVIMAFVYMSVFQTLGLTSVSEMIQQAIAQLPNIIVGIAVIGVGYFIANFVRGIVVSAADAANIGAAGMLGNLVSYSIIFSAAMIGLPMMGIDISFITNNLSIIIAGIVAAGALAIGLGGRDAAANILGSMAARQMVKVGDNVTINCDQFGEVSGKVEAITTTGVKVNGICVPGRAFTAKSVKA